MEPFFCFVSLGPWLHVKLRNKESWKFADPSRFQRITIRQNVDFFYFFSCNSPFPFARMKLLTHNFLNCAAKTCKASPDAFPLKFDQVELTSVEMDYNPQFLINVLPRVDWPALLQTAIEAGLLTLCG
jgi:hypothetical protein